jgi:type I restriction enzyme S subunit
VNKLDELIQAYCPDGVVYKKVGDIAVVGTGRSDKKDATPDGEYPFYVRSKVIAKINTFEFDEEAIVIPGEGGIGEIFHYVTGKYALHQRAYRIHFVDNKVIPKFAYYHFMAHFKVFIMKKAVSATVTSIRKPMITDFPVPVPPLEVQKEIVNILDKFTQLEAELSAELGARREQFEYYREKIIIHNNIGAKIALNTVAKIGDGLHGTPQYSETGEYYFINGNNLVNGELYFGNNTKKVDEETYNKHFIHLTSNESVLMSINGTIGSVSMYKGENVVLGKSVAYFNVFTEKVNSRYLYHILQTRFAKTYFESSKTGSTIKNLGLKALRDFEVPIPAMDTQLEIVDLLDKFEELSYSIIDGLPAEINARRQQYEYYRTKLLTFQELAA